MKQPFIMTMIGLLSVSFFNLIPGMACTDFQLSTSEGVFIASRSMEWGSDFHSRLVIHPEEEGYVSGAPEGKAGLKWISKYGYIGVDGNGLDLVLEGMNEKGLSYGALWMPGYTKYPDVPVDQSSQAIDITDLGAWILGNFTNIDQVKSALGKIHVWGSVVPSIGGVPTVHVALHDATGQNAVIEFVGGQVKFYANPIGILTNAPTFDWHLINLNNYVMIGAENPHPVKIAGTVLSPPGQGGGFLGVPGDWTPPSRFVRTAAMLCFAKRASTAAEGVNLSEHVLNAVDIPKGVIREKVPGQEYTDYTQWIVIKDLTHKVFYFRSYDNLTLRALDLRKLNFEPGGKKRYVAMEGGQPVENITATVNEKTDQ